MNVVILPLLIEVNNSTWKVSMNRLGTIHIHFGFQDLLEGSKDYKELESMAREFFMKNHSNNLPKRTIGNNILDLLQDSSIELMSQKHLLPADGKNFW